jgi:hypothetical protein
LRTFLARFFASSAAALAIAGLTTFLTGFFCANEDASFFLAWLGSTSSTGACASTSTFMLHHIQLHGKLAYTHTHTL